MVANRKPKAIQLRYYNSPESVTGPWYVFIHDENNIRIAQTIRPYLAGKPVESPAGFDLRGYTYGKIIADIGRREYKHSCSSGRDEILFSSGWHE